MKKSSFLSVVTALLLYPICVNAQYAEHALRLSNITYEGSARFTGMGGAFGALGGNFTSLSINPAGIGIFNNSEISFTPAIYNTRSFSKYFNNNEEIFDTKLTVNDFGYVLVVKMPNANLRAMQIGIGYNRLANFNNSVCFSGFNTQNSFLRALSDEATVAYRNGSFFINDPFYADELAAAANLLYYDSLTNSWNADLNNNVNQNALFQTKGYLDEVVFSLGGNYTDKLYFGVTLGLPLMSYESFYKYEESNNDLSENDFKSMKYEESYNSSAVGVNAKFGVIYKPVSCLRLGLAIHTPTYYNTIEESERLKVTSSFYNSTSWNKQIYSPERIFDYSLTTPMRMIGSIAFTAGNIAIISADYEWVDYSMNNLQPVRESSIKESNKLITDNYTSQHILRAGAEIRLNPFFLRGGYGWYSSPYQDHRLNDASTNLWTLGFGFRAGSFGLDFAYKHTSSYSKYYPYNANKYNFWTYSPSPFAELKNKTNSYILTLSYRY